VQGDLHLRVLSSTSSEALPRSCNLVVVVFVDLRVLAPLRGQVAFVEDSVHGTLGDAGSAVDALIGVDEEHFCLFVLFLVL